MRAKPRMLPVHDHAATVGLGCDLHHVRAGEAVGVVHDGGAKAHAHLGDVRVAGVHRDDGTLRDQRTDHGHHALGLLVGGEGLLAGSRRDGSHVDDVSSLVEHVEAALGSGLDVHAALSVREGP